MDDNLLIVLREIISNYGESVLFDPRRVSALFSDLSKDAPKAQKNALIKCLEHGFIKILKNVEVSDRDACKQKLAKELNEEEGLDLNLCRQAIDLFEAVIFGTVIKKENICENCGRKLQEEWKICPFCTTAPANKKNIPTKKNTDTKIQELTKKAEQGHSDAQYDLANCYYDGEGVGQDFDKALCWLTKAAEQGHSDAQYDLANCYYDGEGVEQDFGKALCWLTKAAEQGDFRAQYDLGFYYYTGEGVPQNFEKAVYWYTKAAEQGNSLAQFKLGLCYYEGKGVAQDYAQAVHWYTKAAEQGDSLAQFKLGLCYYRGKGAAQDYAQALHWYTKAAEQGNSLAQFVLSNVNLTE